MGEKSKGIAGQASWTRLVSDELFKALWFTFILLAIGTIFYYISRDTVPRGTSCIVASVSMGVIVGIYRGFYSAFRSAAGKFPRGAKAGILSGLICFTVIGAGLVSGNLAISAGYGVRASVIALFATVIVSFLYLHLECKFLHLENENPEQQTLKE
ncbi:MAG: hypothetical protein NTW66_02835 [Candidatus Magasanikbacteria bacterium]|nr:hypothetical protein [Candidatus Magasanikbacteria bacterium]